MLAASCNKEALTYYEAEAEPIQVRAMTASSLITKAGIAGTTMPTNRQIVVSAYKNIDTDVAGSDTAQDYFEGITFSYDASSTPGKWREAKYWPLTGTLDFLALSTEGYVSTAHPFTSAQLAETYTVGDGTSYQVKTYKVRDGIAPTSITWGENSNCAKKVVAVIPDNSEKQDDILYGALNAQSYNSSGNPIVFKHALSAIAFVASSNIAYNGSTNFGITIDSISIDGAKYSGTLTVNNPAAGGGTGDVSAAWSNLASAKSQYYVQSVKNYPVPLVANKIAVSNIKGDSAPVAYPFGINYCNTYTATGDAQPALGTPWVARNAGVVLPPQDAVPFTIKYTIHNGFKADGTTKLDNKMEYTYTPAADSKWGMAKKTIYDIQITLSEVSVQATITDWTNETAVDVEP